MLGTLIEEKSMKRGEHGCSARRMAQISSAGRGWGVRFHKFALFEGNNDQVTRTFEKEKYQETESLTP